MVQAAVHCKVNMSRQWQASTQKKRHKPAPKETDWNLAGLGAALPDNDGTPRESKRRRNFDSSSSGKHFQSLSMEETTEDELETQDDGKPPESMVLSKKNALKDSLESNTRCPK